MEKSTKTNIISLFAGILLLLIVIGASFAYFGSFTVNLNNNVAVNINSTSPGTSTFTSTSAELNLQVPAANMSQTVVNETNNVVLAAESSATMNVSLLAGRDITDNNAFGCIFDIYFEYTGDNVYGDNNTPKTTGATKEITMQVSEKVTGTSGEAAGGGGYSHYFTETNFDIGNGMSWASNKATLVSPFWISNISSTIPTIATFTFTMRFYNLNADQNALAGKPFTGRIYAEKTECYYSADGFGE